MEIDASLKGYHLHLLKKKKNIHHRYKQYNQLATQKANARLRVCLVQRKCFPRKYFLGKQVSFLLWRWGLSEEETMNLKWLLELVFPTSIRKVILLVFNELDFLRKMFSKIIWPTKHGKIGNSSSPDTP